MDFVWKLYSNTYAVHVTVALVGVATLNLALPPPPVHVSAKDNFGKKEESLLISFWGGGGGEQNQILF